MTKYNFASVITLALAASACSPAVEEETTAVTETASAASDGVEIALSDTLDGILNEYCVDIAGGNEDVDPNNGLQAHTCYSYRGSLGTDQIFEKARFADNMLYMPNYDVCATLAGLTAGSEVGLAACDGSELQAISLTEDGAISPVAAPDMCFTAAEDTRMGKGSDHQIKDMTLESCSEDKAAYQTWRTRATDD